MENVGYAEVRRDVRGPSELNLDEVWSRFHTLRTPVKQGAADSNAARIPAPLLTIGVGSLEVEQQQPSTRQVGEERREGKRRERT